MLTYHENLAIAENLCDRDEDPEEVYVAYVLSDAIAKERKRLKRAKKAIERLESDAQELYEVVLEAVHSSGYGASVRDAVKIVMEGYMVGGMTVNRAETAVSDVSFIINVLNKKSEAPEEGGDTLMSISRILRAKGLVK